MRCFAARSCCSLICTSCSFFLSSATERSFSRCFSNATLAWYSSSRRDSSSKFCSRICSSFLRKASSRAETWRRCWSTAPWSCTAWPLCRPSISKTAEASRSFSAWHRRTSFCHLSAIFSASCCFFSAISAVVCLSFTYICTRSIFWLISSSCSSIKLLICSNFSVRSPHFFSSSSPFSTASSKDLCSCAACCSLESRARTNSSRSALHS
mmetsp:Transcript_14621/g.27450  ORF Transcript_14621/g.27450 Transcript_14621/m.27450 type:complete len:210 (-) Transcript_14621:735-1364(-)